MKAKYLKRIAEALERLAPPPPPAVDLNQGDAFVWLGEKGCFDPVLKVNRVEIKLLQGIDQQKELLLKNTRQFAKGFPANNALLWGARGAGKSSLVKAVHKAVGAMVLVEIHRDEISTLPQLLKILRQSPRRFLLFCDDLSFDAGESSYKSLKAMLEGGIEGRPENVLFYATSNRRHLMAREMIENEGSSAIHTGETAEEKLSLSDRFGLWLGFHNIDQATYFDIVIAYAQEYDLKISRPELEALANEWSRTRAMRSGRAAFQFIQDLAGKLKDEPSA